MASRTSRGAHQKPSAAYSPTASANPAGIQTLLRLIQWGTGRFRDGLPYHGQASVKAASGALG
jgi:hypothetical protein